MKPVSYENYSAQTNVYSGTGNPAAYKEVGAA